MDDVQPGVRPLKWTQVFGTLWTAKSDGLQPTSHGLQGSQSFPLGLDPHHMPACQALPRAHPGMTIGMRKGSRWPHLARNSRSTQYVQSKSAQMANRAFDLPVGATMRTPTTSAGQINGKPRSQHEWPATMAAAAAAAAARSHNDNKPNKNNEQPHSEATMTNNTANHCATPQLQWH